MRSPLNFRALLWYCALWKMYRVNIDINEEKYNTGQGWEQEQWFGGCVASLGKDRLRNKQNAAFKVSLLTQCGTKVVSLTSEVLLIQERCDLVLPVVISTLKYPNIGKYK